jgi:hypothetical protein
VLLVCGVLYAASRAGRAIQKPILPNIRLASLEAGTLRQVLRTGAFNQAAPRFHCGPTPDLVPHARLPHIAHPNEYHPSP